MADAPAPAAPAAKAPDPMAELMAWLKGELSDDAFAKASAMVKDQEAMLKHLEQHLPTASMGFVQAKLGLEL